MRTKMGFGIFQSPLKTMKLVDIAQQFEVVLHALPFMSIASRFKALGALKDFAHHMPPPVVLRPGTTVALHNIFFRRYINADSTGQVRSSGEHNFELGLPPNNQNERWTVVDAGEGQIALHHPRYNGFLRLKDGLDLRRNTAPKDFQASESGWEAETFKVVNLWGGTGIFGLNPATKRFVSVGPGSTYVTNPSDVLHAGWTHQQFRVEVLKPRLTPGTTVGLWSPVWKHWIGRSSRWWMLVTERSLCHFQGLRADRKRRCQKPVPPSIRVSSPPFGHRAGSKSCPPAMARSRCTTRKQLSSWPCQFLAMHMESGAAGILTTSHAIQSLPDSATWERFVVYELASSAATMFLLRSLI